MEQYKNLVRDILDNGIPSDDRTGTGTKSLFGRQLRFDLKQGFPIVTTKKTWWKGVVLELLWFLRGDTNIKFLVDNGVHIWDEWADSNGDLGPVYGKQWRSWESDGTSTDQIKAAIETIKKNPNSRRIIVSAWHVNHIDSMKLPPCHCLFQFYVRNGELSCQLYQRSADVFLGVPFNIASYALLTYLIAHECGLEVGEFVHTFGDVHIYNNHLSQAEEMVSRDCKGLPRLELNLDDVDLLNWVDLKVPTLTWAEIKDKIKLVGYKPHPAIKAKVSV